MKIYPIDGRRLQGIQGEIFFNEAALQILIFLWQLLSYNSNLQIQAHYLNLLIKIHPDLYKLFIKHGEPHLHH
jgi:hypothetical protein